MRAFLLILLALCPSLGQAQVAVTKSNWQRHPSIAAIRQLVAAVDRESASFAAISDSASCHRGEASLEAHLWSDSTGKPRKYRLSGGSGDSAGEARYYYDTAGQLRFIFTETGAVNGTVREDRAYYAADGALLYRNSHLVKGPGYPGGFEPNPIFTPAEHLAHLCDLDD